MGKDVSFGYRIPFIHSFQLFECIRKQEFEELTADQKLLLHIILSQGIIDMSDGGNSKHYIWSIFPAGSTTRKCLKDLLEPEVYVPPVN